MKQLALLATLAFVACAAPAQAAREVIALTSVATSVKSTDVGPKGTSKGDTIVYRDRLLNAKAQFGRPKGAVVGSDHGTMTFTGAHSARFSGVTSLPKGTLRLEGNVVPLANGSFAIPVNGGTGRFAKAKGFLVVGPGDKRAANTYSLTLPSTPVA